MAIENLSTVEELDAGNQQSSFDDIESNLDSVNDAQEQLIAIQNAWPLNGQQNPDTDFEQICSDYYDCIVTTAHTTPDDLAHLNENLTLLRQGFENQDRSAFDRARAQCDRTFKDIQTRVTEQAESVILPQPNETTEQQCLNILAAHNIDANSQAGRELLAENLQSISEASNALVEARRTREHWENQLANARLDRPAREVMIRIRTNVARARKIERKAAHELAKRLSEFNEQVQVTESNSFRNTTQLIRSEAKETAQQVATLLEESQPEEPTPEQSERLYTNEVIEQTQSAQANILTIVQALSTETNIVEGFRQIVEIYNNTEALLQNTDNVRLSALRDNFLRTITQAITHQVSELGNQFLAAAESENNDDINTLQVRRSHLMQATENFASIVEMLDNDSLHQIRGNVSSTHIRLAIRNRALATEIEQMQEANNNQSEEVIELNEDNLDRDIQNIFSVEISENDTIHDVSRSFFDNIASKIDLGMSAMMLPDIIPEFIMNARENAKGPNQSEVNASLSLQYDKENNRAYIVIEDDGEKPMPPMKDRVMEAAQFLKDNGEDIVLPENRNGDESYEWDEMISKMVETYKAVNAQGKWSDVTHMCAKLGEKRAEEAIKTGRSQKAVSAGGLGYPLFASVIGNEFLNSYHYERKNDKNRITLGIDVG